MAAINIKDYSNGVALLAHDLVSGLGVYRSRDQRWLTLDGSALQHATVLYNESDANNLLETVAADVASNAVLDPYLIQLDEHGQPSHIRERMRVSGPSVLFGLDAQQERANVSVF